MRKNSVIIGNGRSRLNFDLNVVKEHYYTYGCNALYRDFIPDTLVSMDIHMVQEILNARAHHRCTFYTQHLNDIDMLAGNGEPIHFIRTLPATPDSGTAAVTLASEQNYSKIYIIGFDYHYGEHNNVYAGTLNYNPKQYSTPTIQDDKWRSRLYNIVKQYPNIEFYRVSDDNDTYTLPNIQCISIEQFKETLC